MNDEHANNLTDAGQNTESEPSSAAGQTSNLRLKTSTADTPHKTQGIPSSSYSITASYQSAVREQQESLYKQRKTRRTLGIVKKTITLVIIVTVILFITIFAVNHIHLVEKVKPKETKSTQETLCDSKWTTDDIGSFTFTEDNKVTRKKGTTETGTYEITNENVLIMHFKKEDLSYLIETDSDGTVKWVHSYNGFEEVIIPNTIPITK